MKTKLLATASALVLGLASFAATAGDDVIGYVPGAEWQIYSWHNWTYEITDVENNTAIDGDDRERHRIRNDAANIGFKASIDTGLSTGGQAVKANFQCEQFVQFGEGAGGDWCNRNSKISLSGAWGEFMFGNWLTPYNEMVAGWIDPYWDADFTSHTSLMGTINSFDYTGPGNGPSAGSGSRFSNGFNKRQSSLVQYFSPNFNGLTFRVATATQGLGDEEVVDSTGATSSLDPRMLEAGVAYTRDIGGNNLWVATTYSQHEEWGALDFNCSDSDDTGMRFAARWLQNWGGGGSTAIAGMFEQLEYDWEDCAIDVSGMATVGTGTELDLEKDTWMVSINHQFGNGWGLRGTYLDADEFDCSTCTTEDDTDATSFSLGVDYTTSGGTMFSLKYAEVDNEANSRYDTGFWAAADGGIGAGNDAEVWGLGITQAF
jgi:predicted porin